MSRRRKNRQALKEPEAGLPAERGDYSPKTRGGDEAYLTRYDPEPPSGFLNTPNRVNLGEVLTFLSLLYVCSISTFNAGYFSKIPGHFTELFSFSDLIGTNIQVLQYFISAFTLFCMVSFFGGILMAALEIDLGAKAEAFALRNHINPGLYLIAFLILWFSVMVTLGVMDYFKITSFTFLVLPELIFQSALIFYFWVGYKFNHVQFRGFLTPALIGLVMFSTASGRAWLKSEIAATDDIQSMTLQDGMCIDRKILRASSNGFLLYNTSMQEFEFRTKESIRTIFQRQRCV